MTFGSMLHAIIFQPLILFFEFVYNVAYSLTEHPALSIIFLSLAMNFLVLPLYKRADEMQNEQRLKEKSMEKDIAFLKKTFKGDERMMVMETYYRQHNYKPIYILKGSLSLALEIPFFVAAYQFLSHLSLLNGVAFGPIRDLSRPDALFAIGSFNINVLPILMTVINIIASMIYAKDAPLRSKIQLYAIALVFLVFLYDSPSGLVFYWTLNNLFSLVKNIFYKLKNPKKALLAILFLMGAGLFGYGLFKLISAENANGGFIMFVGIVLMVPVLLTALSKVLHVRKINYRTPDKKLFLACALLLSIVVGILIPSSVIASSPVEFIDPYSFMNPIWFIVNAALISFGLFLLWMYVFYSLVSDKAKVIFEWVLLLLSVVGSVTYLFFGKNLGTLSNELIYDTNLYFSNLEITLNVFVVIVLSVALFLLFRKLGKFYGKALIVLSLAAFIMCVVNFVTIGTTVKEYKGSGDSISDIRPHITLSKTGKNVVVIMLDRAMGEYIPFMMKEMPELADKLSGFTYYSNVISYASHTIFAVPALFGGYEYTPVALNLRDQEKLEDKHNESLKVLPTLFSQKGFDVTVMDAPYAGYSEIPDLSIYDDNKDIKTYITEGYFRDEASSENLKNTLNRNFVFFGLMKVMPIIAQDYLYEGGNFHSMQEQVSTKQVCDGKSKATGLNSGFMKSYEVLKNMTAMTSIEDNEQGTFLMMDNNITHSLALLSAPDYEPKEDIDNTEYDDAHKDRFRVGDETMTVNSDFKMRSYHTNLGALLALSKWFDYLKENDLYDNTRIILVSDHGYPMGHNQKFLIDETGSDSGYDNRFGNAEAYYPLLMMKDFNATEFTTDDSFMTNADVPTLSLSGVIENPVNPFTGKALNNDAKLNETQYVLGSKSYGLSSNRGTQFKEARWYSVHTDMRNAENWTLVQEKAVLPY